MTNWKLNVWDAIEIEDTKFEITWITNDPKFQGKVTLSIEDRKLFTQLLLDKCVDVACWELLKSGDVSCLRSGHQPGSRSRAKRQGKTNVSS